MIPRFKRLGYIGAQVVSYLLFILTVFSAYGGYFNPMRSTIPAILLLFFPFFAIFTLIVSGLWLFFKRYIIGAIGIGCLLLSGPTFIDAFPLKFHASPTPDATTFKMVTYNCYHFGDLSKKKSKRNPGIDFLINCGADFICLQELYGFSQKEIPTATKAQLDSLFAIYPYRSEDGWREEEFISKYPFEIIPLKLKGTEGYGNWAVYRLKIKGKELTVVNVHLPSYLLSKKERHIITGLRHKGGARESVKELEGSVMKKMHNAFINRGNISSAIAKAIGDIEGPIIVCGDFNDVPGSWTYRRFMKEGFLDAYAQTGFGHLITYNRHLMYFHIDQILYKGLIKPLYVKKDKLRSSDHYPLIAEFEFLE